MRRPIRAPWAWPIALLCCAALPAARAEPADPLRLLPADTDLLVKVEQPRRLVESVTNLDLIKDLYHLEPLQELLQTTSVRRFFQFLGYVERELGAPWPELLDRLAGGGAALGVKYYPGEEQEPQAVAVIQGKDAALTEKFYRLALQLVESELARSEAKTKFERGGYKGYEGFRLAGLFVARAGDALLLASSNEALKGAIDRHEAAARGEQVTSLAGAKGPKEARALLPDDPLAWVWLDLGFAKSAPQAKELFARPRNDVAQTVLFGGTLDAARRADFLAAGLYQKEDGFLATLRLPAKRSGLAEEMALHVPPEGKPGTLPLLTPRGVLFSHSFYFDFNALWEHRTKLFPEQVAKSFEKGVKQGSRFVPGGTLQKVFARSGPYHRFVATAPRESAYKTEPLQKLPAMAFVTSMRDPAFTQTVEPLIRLGALYLTQQFGLTMKESEHDGVKIVSYHFPENRDLPGDVAKLRFNFTPCFASVNDQFIVGSCVPLCEELIDAVRKEDRSKASPANLRMRLYAEGVKAALSAAPDQLVTQAVLDQAVPIAEAKERVAEFLAWLERAGALTFEMEHAPKSYQVSIRWKYGK